MPLPYMTRWMPRIGPISTTPLSPFSPLEPVRHNVIWAKPLALIVAGDVKTLDKALFNYCRKCYPFLSIFLHILISNPMLTSML
jgi:hypothetical protein